MKILADFKKQFDREINIYLDEKIKLTENIDKKGSDLIKIIKEFINNGGKRLRPAIFYYSFLDYSSQNSAKVLKLSFIFELFHSFALIHDDIIDNSDLRRGKPTVHKKYDLSTAILAGDLALMLADEIFSQEINEKKIIDLYNEFKQELLVGEYLDTIKIDDVNKIMELKTARYSFVKPAIIALSLAKVEKDEIKKWEEILRKTGILFQMKDDFDGTFGDEKKIGKSTDTDIKDGKNTLIIKRFLEKSNNKEKTRFNSFFGKSNSKLEDVIWLKKNLKIYRIDVEFKEKILNESKNIEKKLSQDFPDNKLTKLIKEILVYFQSTV
ncbi:MAG: polyprenyl synthetase family protein [Patescibacteria group bacterium]